jgi:hypothetical protein
VWIIVTVVLVVVLAAGGALAAWLILSDRGEDAEQPAGCGPVQTFPSEGGEHALEPPPGGWGTTPATSGVHSPPIYVGDPVIGRPVDPALELMLVHNLEHAYVIAYYQPEGDSALPAEVLDRLAAIARLEEKVLVAPYPDLPGGTSLALVAWTKMQTCSVHATGDPEGIASVMREFVEEFRGAGAAPEPAGP